MNRDNPNWTCRDCGFTDTPDYFVLRDFGGTFAEPLCRGCERNYPKTDPREWRLADDAAWPPAKLTTGEAVKTDAAGIITDDSDRGRHAYENDGISNLTEWYAESDLFREGYENAFHESRDRHVNECDEQSTWDWEYHLESLNLAVQYTEPFVDKQTRPYAERGRRITAAEVIVGLWIILGLLCIAVGGSGQ